MSLSTTYTALFWVKYGDGASLKQKKGWLEKVTIDL